MVSRHNFSLAGSLNSWFKTAITGIRFLRNCIRRVVSSLNHPSRRRLSHHGWKKNKNKVSVGYLLSSHRSWSDLFAVGNSKVSRLVLAATDVVESQRLPILRRSRFLSGE